MFKLILLTVVLIIVSMSAANAQPFFSFQTGAPAVNQPAPSTTSSNIATQINQKNSQTVANYQQQLQQRLSAIKTPPIDSFDPKTPIVVDNASSTPPMTSTPKVNSPINATAPPPPPINSDNPFSASTGAPVNASPPPSTTSTTTSTTMPAPASANIYTGFGNNTTPPPAPSNPPPANNAPNNNTNSSSTWNIQY